MGNLCEACKDAKEKSKPSSILRESSNFSNGILIDPSSSTTAKPIGSSASDNKLTKSPTNNGSNTTGGNGAETLLLQHQRAQAEVERQRALREEQERLESIILTAGRDMVPLDGGEGGGFGGIGNGLGGGNFCGGGGGGGVCRAMTYYDPAYTASITQDLMNNQVNGGFEGLHVLYQKMEENSHKLTNIVLGQNQLPKTCVENGVSAIEVLSEKIDFTQSSRGIMRYDDFLGGGGSGSGNGGGGDEMEYFEDVAESFLASVLCTKEALFQDIGPIVENLP